MYIMRMLPFLLPLLLVGAMGCTQPVLKKIDVATAKSLIDSKDKNLQVVDLRTPGEIAATGTLPGASAIDFMAPSFAQKVKTLDKNRPVLLYCAAGSRSAQAAEMLHQQKFKMVYELSAGMNGWLAAGNQTSKQQ